jgi:ABC-type transport system involved in multi-copper enzyme maturation permease subunit
MRPWQEIARTEVLEHRRQPAMLFILALNYTILIAAFGAFLVFARAPEAEGLLFGVDIDALLATVVTTFHMTVFANLAAFVAITSGYSVLHDRTTGTLPFLMLAPVTRFELLAGKLAGAMVIPTGFHLLFVGTSSLVLGRLELLEPYAASFGGSSAWWVAFLLGAPASGAFVGALGTVISSLSSDVRTSMQYTSFFIGLLSLGIGYALVDAVGEGVELQLAFAAACLVLAALTLRIGANIISRDITPS